jgi:hypothetical protein
MGEFRRSRAVVAERNRQLRQLVLNTLGGNATADTSTSSSEGDGRGAPLMLLDIDALTQRLPVTATLAPRDFHYQCYPHTNVKFKSELAAACCPRGLPGHAPVLGGTGSSSCGSSSGGGGSSITGSPRLLPSALPSVCVHIATSTRQPLLAMWLHTYPGQLAPCAVPQRALWCGLAANATARAATGYGGRPCATTTSALPAAASVATQSTLLPGSCCCPCCARRRRQAAASWQRRQMHSRLPLSLSWKRSRKGSPLPRRRRRGHRRCRRFLQT